MVLHHLVPSIFYYTYGPNDPALHIQSGDQVSVDTRDAFGMDANGNPLPEHMKQQQAGTSLRQSNPAVGPIYVDEAQPGDLLRIDIEQIEINRDWGRSRQGPNFGSLTGETPGHRLLYNAPIQEIDYHWQFDLARHTGSINLPNSRIRRVQVPLCPFIGSIGVAPAYGRVEMTLTAGEYGGNMDCPDTQQGTTLYLPVWAAGAYLEFGDIHALQGDGELNGTAVETTAQVTLGISLMKSKQASWPRLESDTDIMVIASTRPLMDCVRLAQVELLEWLVQDYGFQREEAWQLNAQVGSMRIGNVVDPCYSVVARFPKACLPS
ncbi:MAG: acetamidase/formamidase family protein [Anaerolineae bacterium]